jgi:hypothetical protein
VIDIVKDHQCLHPRGSSSSRQMASSLTDCSFLDCFMPYNAGIMLLWNVRRQSSNDPLTQSHIKKILIINCLQTDLSLNTQCSQVRVVGPTRCTICSSSGGRVCTTFGVLCACYVSWLLAVLELNSVIGPIRNTICSSSGGRWSEDGFLGAETYSASWWWANSVSCWSYYRGPLQSC